MIINFIFSIKNYINKITVIIYNNNLQFKKKNKNK